MTVLKIIRYSLFGVYCTGVALGSIVDYSILNIKDKYKNISFIIVMAAVCLLLLFAYQKNIAWLLQCEVLLVCIAILFSTKVEIRLFNESKILKYMSTLTYHFYILQLFIWTPSSYLVNYFGLEEWKYNFIIPMMLLIVASVLVHEIYEKPLQKVLLKNK